MRRTLPVLLVTLVAAAPASAPAQEPVVIATLPNVTPLRALGDTVVWSTRAAPDGDYRLTLRRDGITRTLPVASRPDPGDFDLGTDASGAPLLVYTRCADSCDLYTATLDGAERRIAAASSPRADESAPTVWRGRLAWARGDVVYTRRLSDPASVRSRRLFTVPRRTCPDGPSSCARTRGRSVDELELYGRNLAAVPFFVEPQGTGHGHTRVQLVDVSSGRSRVVRDMAQGEGGQTFLGPSFVAGRLGFAISCFGDPGGCGAGAHRYRLRTGDLERTAQGRQLNGFATAGSTAERAFVLTGSQFEEAGEDEVCPCKLESRVLTGWRPVGRR